MIHIVIGIKKKTRRKNRNFWKNERLLSLVILRKINCRKEIEENLSKLIDLSIKN